MSTPYFICWKRRKTNADYVILISTLRHASDWRYRGIMHFDNLRDKSVKIGKDRKLKKVSDAFRKTAGCIPSAVVKMTTVDGMLTAFSGRHPKLLIISDLYRVVTETTEVHSGTAHSFLKCIMPIYFNALLENRWLSFSRTLAINRVYMYNSLPAFLLEWKGIEW